MKKGNVSQVQGGFSVTPTQEYTEKQAREQRIADRKANPPTNPTIKDLWDFMQDIADRQSEILEKLNTK
jgi:hypothetical protein